MQAMRASRQWNFTEGGAVIVAVGHATGLGVVDVVEVVTSWIGMRGSVRERGRVLWVVVSYEVEKRERGWGEVP